MSLGPVEIFEVGPRDGLQNEAAEIAVVDKVALVDCLSRAGFQRIECASFVSPKWVPQMAGSGEVLAGIKRAPGVRYAALTPNMRGFEDAQAVLAAHPDQTDSRVLTYWGFTHRKLGNRALSQAYYDQAIAADPDNLLARSYMGQGFVEEGQFGLALA